jgi:hypothetical protein
MNSGKFGKKLGFLKSRMMLEDVLDDAMEVYRSREKQYGDSWRSCEVSFLLKRLLGEIDEANYLIQSEAIDWDKDGKAKLHHELLDIINVSAMLASRLKDKK